MTIQTVTEWPKTAVKFALRFLSPSNFTGLEPTMAALPIIGQNCILQTSRHLSGQKGKNGSQPASEATFTASATAASTSASAASFLPQALLSDSCDFHDSFFIEVMEMTWSNGARKCGINKKDSDIGNQEFIAKAVSILLTQPCT